MKKILPKHGNSYVLRITKQMREYLEVTGDEVDLEYVNGAIMISKPRQGFEEAKQASLEQFDNALRNLAKG